jgi:hypothetical protein
MRANQARKTVERFSMAAKDLVPTLKAIDAIALVIFCIIIILKLNSFFCILPESINTLGTNRRCTYTANRRVKITATQNPLA